MSLARIATLTGPPLVRGLLRLWRLLLALCLLVASLWLLAWLTLHWGILPHIDEWRPRIEALATRSVGAPVRIGRIEVRSGGWVPALHLHQVALLDADGREALKLPRVSSALSVPALLALELRFEQLLIEDAELEIRRDDQGRIRVAGLDLSQGEGGGDTALADWFFEQHEFVIRGGTLRWTDDLRQAPPLALTDVQLVVRNGLRRHDLRLDATPPPEWGDRFSLRTRLRAPLLARAGDWRRWSGELHAELPRADVGSLRRHVDLPFDLRQGSGALRLWVDLRDGEPRGATADVALREVQAQLGAKVEPLTVAALTGRLVAERDGDRTRLQASGLAFTTGDGVAWPASRVGLTLRQAGQGAAALAAPVLGGELTADRIELAPLAAIVGRLPVGDPLRRLLAGMAPQGRVQDVAVRWDGPPDAPRQYQVKALFKGVSIAAAPSPDPAGVGRPGVRRADIDLSATEGGGDARLLLADGALEFPGVFEQPVVALRKLDAQLAWRVTPDARAGQPPQVELHVKQAQFDAEDMQGELAGRWRTGGQPGFGKGLRLPGTLDLAGKLTRGKATAVARYLPQGLPRQARTYVQRAVQGGDIAAADFKVKGDLWAFPFYNAQEGEFNITAQVRDVTLAYVPSEPASATEPAWDSPWPALAQARGELVFDGRSMTLRDMQARLWGLALDKVQGRIPDFADSVLQLDGQVRGPLADLLRFMNTTPVGGWTSNALAAAATNGDAQMALALTLPLQRLAQSSVKGSITLAGNDVRLRPDVPPLEAARGRVDFSHKGLQVVGASARVLGGEATFDGGTQPDGSLRFNGQGVATAEALRRPGSLPEVVSRIATVARGQAPFKLQLGFVKGWPEVLVTSPLTGMAVDLPAPLGKSAEATMPLRVQTTMAPESLAPGQAARDQLRLDVGGVAQAVWLRELSTGDARVLRSAMAVNAPLPAPVAGGHAVLDLGALDVDAWQGALDRMLPPAAERAPGAVAGSPPGTIPARALAYMPDTVALRATELVTGQRRITGLVLALTHDHGQGESTWRGNVDADQLGGYVEYRSPRSAGQAGRVYARLARLSLPPSEAQAVEGLLDQAPASVPALDVVIDDFELRGRKLGRLELQAANRGVALGDDSPREWRLTRLALRTPEAALTGSGRWAAVAGSTRRRMVLDFSLELADSGALLQRLGFGRVIQGGKGRLAGQVAWSGSPLALDLPSMDGRMVLALDEGQFLKADAGAARLLGVLSLQALPRRLALDFRDVFQEGFAFDNVTGDLAIERGVASTRNLRMRGVQAAVLMAGQADIARETQDLRVVVVPEINAGTASLAYAAINPAVGLTTFLAQWLLRRPLAAANTREFRVTGPWADPKVERVERKPGEAPPDPDPPAAAASAPPKSP